MKTEDLATQRGFLFVDLGLPHNPAGVWV